MARLTSTDVSPLFTVIIPSKDRAQYLYHTLRTCMMQNYEHLEVLVSDDGSTENNREVIEDAMRLDPRIRFITPGGAGGMRENFEFALRQVKPGFVIALGGDDGLLPDGIQGMCDVLHETGANLLAWPAPIFSYPNVRGAKGQLAIHRAKGTRLVSSRGFLHRQARELRYSADIESPMLYVKGVASTDLVERVRARSATGAFFSCATPDGFSGIVLAGEVPQYAFSGRPFSLFGLSSGSQGLAYLSNDDNAKATSASFMKSASERPMHGDLASQPYSPLITLMTADYLLTARDLPGWPGDVPPLDFRQILLNGIRELAHGLYGDQRIRRELGILNQIAELHSLGDFFRQSVRRAHRRRPHGHFEGTGVNLDSFLLDATDYDLHDIVDAAYAAKFLYTAYTDLTAASIVRTIVRSAKHRWNARGRGGPFPPESEWAARDSTEPVG